jgi:hypothetical protein
MQEIMLDLECTDNKRTAAIVSIGAIYFDIEKQTIGLPFYCEISIKGIKRQLEAGRTLSLDTMAWWLAQSDDARNVWQKNGHKKLDIVPALHSFSKYCELATGSPRIWGNGSDYDNVALRDCYETFNIKAPWHTRDNRCYRTIFRLFNKAYIGLERQGVHHNGLDDAKTQAIHLMKMLKDIEVNT